MKTAGILITIFGVIVCISSLMMETTVETYSGSVNNIGLIQNQNLVIIISLTATMIGVLLLIGGHIAEIVEDKLCVVTSVLANQGYYNEFPGFLNCEKCSKEFRLSYESKNRQKAKCPFCEHEHDLANYRKVLKQV